MPASARRPAAPDTTLRRASEQHERRLMQAHKTLLIAELQQLESILKKTPKNAPDRALLLRRIAEVYAELAARAERERFEKQELADREARKQRSDAQKRSGSEKKKPARPRGESTLL
jgi:hypothetical protein